MGKIVSFGYGMAFFFSEVPDFRIERGKLHQLSDILMLSLCAVLSGAEDYDGACHQGYRKLRQRERSVFTYFFSIALWYSVPRHDK
ncbi:MAG: transposase family protein [Cytophagales bacterium]|nr:MAG: transposase family protein [Cytophagales bacterium]